MAEVTVCEHLLRQVANFYINRQFVKFVRNGLQHLVEQVFSLEVTLGIFSFAQYAAMHKEKWGQDRSAVTDDGK